MVREVSGSVRVFKKPGGRKNMHSVFEVFFRADVHCKSVTFLFLMMVFSETLKDECTALGLSKSQFSRKDNSPRSTGQLLIHRPGTFLSGMLFDLFCMLYVDGGAFIYKSSTDIEKVNSDSIVEPSSPVLIVMIDTSSSCGINASHQVANKLQSTSPSLVGQTQKLDTVVDGKLHDDLDCAFIFSNVIGHKL